MFKYVLLFGFKNVLEIMLFSNLGLMSNFGHGLLIGVYVSHWSVIEHRTRKQDMELGKYKTKNSEKMATQDRGEIVSGY